MGETRSHKISLQTSRPWLPIDILATHILPRLPARALLQYKCVCKDFQSVISSSQFLRLHLGFHPFSSTSISTRLLLLVTSYKPIKGGDHDQDQDQCLYSLAFDSLESDDKPPRARNLPLPETLCERSRRKRYNFNKWDNHSIYVVGCCNGLVCLGFPWSDDHGYKSTWGEYFMFLNPLTGMFSTDMSFQRKGSRSGLSTSSFGFGYDGNNDDYKVVEVTNYLYNYPISGYPGGREVTVYSLKANSWKRVEAASYQESYQPCCKTGVLVHTHLLHWLFLYPSERIYRIVCFDLESEQWAAHVPLPRYLNHLVATNSPTLGVLDGRLCLLLDIVGVKASDKRTEVWIMNKYGVKESWMKLFSTTPHLPNNAFLFDYWRRTRRNELLLNLDDWPQLGGEGCYWYNFKRNTTKKFEIDGAPPFKLLTLCLESLAPVFRGSSLEQSAKEQRQSS